MLIISRIETNNGHISCIYVYLLETSIHKAADRPVYACFQRFGRYAK